MKTSKTVTYEIDIPEGVFIITVEIHGDYDRGVWTFSNGDPGYPESEERDYKITDMIEIDEDGKDSAINENHLHFGAIDRKVYDLAMNEELDYYSNDL